MKVAALVLAAGASTRFGSPKALARLDGAPILEHVLDAIREAGIDDIVVVLGNAADEIEAGIDWLDERLVRNPDPRELSTSLQVGFDAIASVDEPPQAVLVTLGDQPRTRADVIRALIVASRASPLPVIVPRYADGGGANPVLIRREAFDIVDETSGDRGLGPVLETRPELLLEVPVGGTNPDVDTPDDLEALQQGAPA
jgi:molybdenum cofactor cytidylyltransferase